MATPSASRTCLRILRQQAHHAGFEKSRPIHTCTRKIPTRATPQRGTTAPVSALRAYATNPTSTSSAIDGNPTAASTDPEKNPQAAEETTSDFVETYAAQKATEALFKECARQADYTVPQAFEKEGEVPKNAAGEDVGEGTGWWYDTLGFVPTFNTWAQVTFLHLYIITVRVRYFPPHRSSIWLQHLTDHLFFEAEHRMTLYHQMSSRAIRNRYLKELFNQWRGVLGAYDEGLVKGDAVLATAVWRNLFKGADDADWRRVAQVTSYIRRGLKGLDGASDDVLERAKVRFAGPDSEEAIVMQESRGLNAPFEAADEAGWEAWSKKLQGK